MAFCTASIGSAFSGFLVLLLHLGIQLPSIAYCKRNLFFIDWFVPLPYCCREQDCRCDEHLFVFVQGLIPLLSSYTLHQISILPLNQGGLLNATPPCQGSPESFGVQQPHGVSVSMSGVRIVDAVIKAVLDDYTDGPDRFRIFADGANSRKANRDTLGTGSNPYGIRGSEGYCVDHLSRQHLSGVRPRLRRLPV
jgi:hypothetical protein